MSIPPFPPQHLAKLVLGYLADEQLMTAYDEFLQASPYLDAMQNEYDRIFMTSLKSVVSDFWAVKLYVESCKPYSLRKRLLGCRNQLEVVKFLIDNIDISKFQSQDTSKKSLESKNVTHLERSVSCETCNLQKLPTCVCKNILGQQSSTLLANANGSKSLESLVETTSLSDLPGNIIKKKKQVKILPKDSVQIADTGSLATCDISVKSSPPINCQVAQNRLDCTHSCSPFPVRQNHEVNASSVSHFPNPRTDFKELNTNRFSCTGTFQDFSSGIRGCESTTAAVPDSSTSKNMTTQNLTPQGAHTPGSTSTISKAHILLTVGTMENNVLSPNTQGTANTKDITPKNYIGNLRPKPADHKVTILSDIKVNKTYTKNKTDNVPAVLKNTTSTPLMQMQTILINGTPVYKQSQINSNRNFTKDEIMAMPTIIVVPTSNSLQGPSTVHPQTAESQSTPQVSSIESSTQSLGPLVIDVPSSSSELSRADPMINDLHSKVNTSQNSTEGMLVKTVDVRNVSAPKDVLEVSARSTPQMLPPPRKSSSTPRRTSHVRVLDFTTPRRILKESICEQTEHGTELEVIISKSPNLHMLANPKPTDSKVSATIDNMNDSGSSKENDMCPKIVPHKKKNNWDADLRAMAVTNAKEDIPMSRIQPRCRPRSKPAKKNKPVSLGNAELNIIDVNIIEKSSINVKNDPHVVEKSVILVQEAVNPPVKPTINIITVDKDWNSGPENDQLQNKSNNEDPVETPDMDRTSLQNAIGAKLNISDLLETPYKQALYDIQMETPRFLGPDLPGEPLSDIKIMNIPTPLFLNTPKPINATPSSYSSRPTDYSSGGSYYKPDDQDYIPDDISASISKESEVANDVIDTPLIEERNSKSTCNSARSSRPIRNCTKNVSYCPLNSKTNDASNSQVEASSSESTKRSKCVSKKVEKAAISQKVENKRQSNNMSKRRKTPIKKGTPKSFVKIKPRRVTPIKKGVKSKKKTETDIKKLTTEKGIDSTPVVVPVPTKSRRKSSTPRKLHCTKNYDSENFVDDNDPSDNISSKKVHLVNMSPAVVDSDTELLPLRWSDDGSQDAKLKDVQSELSESVAEIEDINKIKEYIDAGSKKTEYVTNYLERTGNLHIDLVKRGFDIETAKIIERDLLDAPLRDKDNLISKQTDLNIKVPLQNPSETKTDTTQVQEEEEEDGDDLELVVDECTEDSFNYITCNHDETKELHTCPINKLKDSFSMEVCMDDGEVIRLRATPFSIVLDEDPQGTDIEETAIAVDSISNIEKLYTPMKESVRAQVYEIFDSTLTSLDTPLKPSSPKRKECDTTVTEIVLEVEKIDDKERSDTNKRKRLHSTDSDDLNDNKKPKAEYLLNSTNIKNIDIETVLSKLHGP